MRLYSSNQIREWEQFTIEKNSIKEAELMERASILVANWIDKKLVRDDISIAIVTGWGNNGGDGFTVARILSERGLSPKIFDISPNKKNELCEEMAELYKGDLKLVYSISDLSEINDFDLIIDAIMGIGANRPFSEPFLSFVQYINENAKHIMAIDTPSGMLSEGLTDHETINANETLTFTSPKLSFFSSTNEDRLGKWVIRDIGLSDAFQNSLKTNKYYITRSYITGRIKKRKKFTHKGTYGHSLLIGGEKNKSGAISLAAESTYRTGAGLVTVGSCENNRIIIQNSLRELMFLDLGENAITNNKFDLSPYNTIAIGPGIGINKEVKNILLYIFKEFHNSIVIDADGLNTISKYNLHENIPKNSILTPHPKEFDRLFGEHKNDFDRRNKQLEKSVELEIYIILKGSYTSITTPSGKILYNSTGNPGMATGGTGDILCGIVSSFIAQSYSPFESCILAVYLHGLAGDLAAKDKGEEFIIASDLIPYFSSCFNMIK